MDPFEVRCSCGGNWEARVPLRDGYKFFGLYAGVDDVVYACNGMEECAGMGVRHRPIAWRARCQNVFCRHGAPVVLQGDDITKLPGFKGFDRRNASFKQSYDVYWECRTGHDKDNLTRTLLAYCTDCRAEIEQQDAERRRFDEVCRLCMAVIPRRPALRFQDIEREYRQSFKKSVKGRRGVGRKAENAFYSHVVYRDNLHEGRIKALEDALKALKLKYPQDQDIQSISYGFFWRPLDGGVSIHSLLVEFPPHEFSLTFIV